MLQAVRDKGLFIQVALMLGLMLIVSHGAAALELVADAAVDVRAEWHLRIEGKETRLEAPAAQALPLTLGARFTVHDMGSSSGPERIFLATLEEPNGAEALTLVWAPSPSNWFGTIWTLQLHSVYGIEHGNRTVSFVELATINPVAGNRYEVLLSVDEAGTSLALSIVDRTAGKSLYRGVVYLAGLPPELVPAAGVTGKGRAAEAGEGPLDAPVSFERITLLPLWLPVGAQLHVGTPTRSGQIVPVQRFGLDDTVGVGLTGIASESDADAWRLTVLDAQGQVRTLDPTALLHGGRLELPTTQLPFGSGRLRLEYVSPEGEVLLRGEREIAIGTVRFQVTEFVADKTRGELRGEMTVSSRDVTGELGVRVEGVLEQLTWSEERREYVPVAQERLVLYDEVVEVGAGGRQIRFTASLPEVPGTWRLRLEPTTDVGAGIDSFGLQERWFTTYPPAEIQPGEAFTIAILPDTQLYSWNYPYIFTRQTAWLAEVAAERNIGMVLHLGDVTEKNERWEWERADQAMGLLDGVIPYAVTVGNHDIIDGSYSVYNRNATLLHEFFPPERFTHLTGTFEPGKVENSYHLVTLGDRDFLFLMLEYAPRDEVLAWADEVLAAYPDHTAIVVTHTYLAGTGTARISPYSSSDYPQKSPLARVEGETVNDGEQVWDKLIRWHRNVLMVWSGHIPTTAIRHRMSAGAAFNPVYELLADFQGEPLGGSGWLVLIEFAPDGTITARTYSPYLDTYNTTVDQYGFTNHIIIEAARGRVHRLSE